MGGGGELNVSLASQIINATMLTHPPCLEPRVRPCVRVSRRPWRGRAAVAVKAEGVLLLWDIVRGFATLVLRVVFYYVLETDPSVGRGSPCYP